MKTESIICGLVDKKSYDCNGRMSEACFGCNLVIETTVDLPECRICEEKTCIQMSSELVGEFRNGRVSSIYDGKLDNCSYRNYKLNKEVK
jgi:hypothetical protein